VIRVLVVDDHPIVREGIVASLGVEPDVTVVASLRTAEEALDSLSRLHPDVLVLDHGLPGASGVDTCQHLRRRAGGPAVVLLTGSPNAALLRRALQAGAVAFVAKDSAPSVLRDAVRAAHAGEPYIDPSLARVVIDLAERSTAKRGPYGLTRAELEVVALLPKGLMNREIATELGIAENTVKTHLRHALRKLDVRDRAQAAAIVVKEGWA
jgi:DNA-binding NarL/FixJ family response regulator